MTATPVPRRPEARRDWLADRLRELDNTPADDPRTHEDHAASILRELRDLDRRLATTEPATVAVRSRQGTLAALTDPELQAIADLGSAGRLLTDAIAVPLQTLAELAERELDERHPPGG